MKYIVEIDEDGNKIWFNEKGQKHREDGPAIEGVSGAKKWYKNGKLHREDGPAIEDADGDKMWYKNDILHREDGPAIEWNSGGKWWYFEGKLHCTTEPAFTHYDGSKTWYTHGKIHRIDGPAYERADGTKEWWLNGIEYNENQFLVKMNLPVIDANGNKFWHDGKGFFHREDGPAFIWKDGSKTWYKHGLRHRDDGPAIEDVIDGPSWYLDGNYLTKTQFMDIKNNAKRVQMNKTKVVKMTMAEVNKMAGCIVEIVESH